MVKKLGVGFFGIVFVLLVALFLRFYNFENRWTLNQDQARDGVIALYALQNIQLPLLGPPSSAGNFSFGPLYYWIIMILTLLIPMTTGPWIGFTLISVFVVFLFYKIGQDLGGSFLAISLGLISATASLSVYHAPDMLNPMLIGISVVASFYFLERLIIKRSKLFALLFGFFVGASVNFHFQSLGFIFLPVIAIFAIPGTIKEKIKCGIFILIGHVLAFVPLIYFDLNTKFSWSKSVLDYFLHGQEKFNISYNFINDLIVFWPKLWGEVIVGIPDFGYFFVLLLIAMLILSFWQKKFLHKTLWVIFFTFLVQIVILNLYKGPRMPIYLLIYHPFLIFLTGYSVWFFYKLNKYFGIFLLCLIVVVSLYSDWRIINEFTQTSSLYKLKQQIDTQVPGQKQIFTYEGSSTVSLPLYYLWLKKGNISDTGRKIGICLYSITRDTQTFDYIENCPDKGGMLFSDDKYRVFDLDQVGQDELWRVKPLTSPIIYGWIYDRYNSDF